MPAVITTILSYAGIIGIPAIVAGAVALYITHFARDALNEKIRASIRAGYDDRLEVLKAELKADAEVALERTKHVLALEANRINLQFSRLHEKRASVIAEVYEALTLTYDALRNYTVAFEPVGIATKEERFAILAEKHKVFRNLFTINRLFLPTLTVAKIDQMNRTILETGNIFQFAVQSQKGQVGQAAAWLDITRKVEGPMKDAIEDLEEEFRKLLGGD